MNDKSVAEPAASRDKTAIQVIERMMKLLDALASHADPVNLN